MNNYIKALLVVVVAVLFYRWWRHPSPNFPPGPRGLPILGVSLSFSDYIQRDLKNWSVEEYGPVMSVRIGTRTQVILNNYDAIKEAFVDLAPDIDGRPSVAIFEEAQGQYGLLLLDYPNNYPFQRKIGRDALVKLGLGSKGVEQIIHEELNNLIPHLATKTGKSIDLRWDMYGATTNVLARVLFGKRYDYHDKYYQDFLKLLKSSLVDPHEAKLIFGVTFLPFLRHVPPLSGALNRFVQRFHELHEVINEHVKEHHKNFNENNLKDFMDIYIYHQKNDPQAIQKGSTNHQLVAYVRDMFGGGAETTGQELYWALLCALRHPEFADIVKQEISSVIGEERLPNYDDRLKMPFTSAFLEETWRISTPIEKSIDHRTLKDVKLAGYDLPKNTEVVANQWGSNHDPVTFPEPRKFNPYRHIGKDGKMKKLTKVISLGYGNHFCIGKEIAQMEVFLMFTRLLQKFEITAQTQPLPTLYDTNSGLTNNPKDYNVMLKPRSSGKH